MLSSVGVPEVKSEPNGLFRSKVGMAGERPQAADDEATLKIFRVILVLEVTGDPGGGVVFVLGILESPLLLIGKELENDEDQGDTGEDQVRKFEGFAAGKAREEEEVIGRGREEE